MTSHSLLRKLETRIMEWLNVALMTAPIAIAWFQYYEARNVAPFYYWGNWAVIALFPLLYSIFCNLYKGFQVSLIRGTEIVYSQMLSALLADGIMYFVIWILTRYLQAVWPLLLALVVQFAASALWAFIAPKVFFARNRRLNAIVVWGEYEGEQTVDGAGFDKRFRIVNSVSLVDFLNSMDERYVRKAQAIFLCDVPSHDRNRIVKHFIERDVEIYIIPRIGDMLMSGAEPSNRFRRPMMYLKRYDPTVEYLFLKRAFDILISLIALIVLSPLMAVVSFLISLDGGSVFYKQKRLTKDGAEFYVLKFRSMRMDAEKDGVARLSTGGNDDRITKVGRVIRACRIDELPQLANILKGEMSLVGPRPERPEIAAEYEKTLPEFSLRLQAKAGLTGYAQVYGRYNSTPYDKLLMDLQYIAHPSLAEDLKILFVTVKILFLPESTEGVAEGQTTAAEPSEDKSRLKDVSA